MKKLLPICIIIVLVSGLQADAFKLISGLNLKKYSLQQEEQNIAWNYNLGFCFGAGVELDLSYNGNIAIEIDGLMIQKKGSEVKNPDLPDLKSSYRLTTMSIPVMMRIRFTEDSPFYVLGGPVFSIILSHKFTTTNKNVIDLKEDTKTLDNGVVLGCGFKTKISSYQDFFIEARYHYGFGNMLKEPFEGKSLKTSTFLVVFGIKNY